MKCVSGWLISIFLWAGAVAASELAEAEWQLITPGNTGIPGEQILFSEFDPEGRLWVGARSPFSGQGGVGVYDGTRWKCYSNLDSPLPAAEVYCAAFEKGGAVWLGTAGGAVRMEEGYWTLYSSANSPLPADPVRDLLVDQAGHVWLIYEHPAGSGSGVAMLDGGEWSVWSATQLGFPTATELSVLAMDGNGQIWVGTRNAGGVARYDWQSWLVLNAASGFSDAPATGMTSGADGLWLNWDGIKNYNGHRWQHLPSLPDAMKASTVAVDVSGNCWAGTAGGTLARYDDKAWRVWDCGEPVHSISISPEGQAWCSGVAHVRRLNADDRFSMFSSFNTGLTDHRIRRIHFDLEGRAWIATASGGLCAFDGTSWQDFNPENDGAEPWPFTTFHVADVLCATDGTTWAALGEHGAARWDGAEWTPYLTGYHVTCLTEDASGQVWAGFTGGAGVFREEEFTCFGPWDGLPGGYVNAISGDAAGNVWLGTLSGLVRYDGERFELFANSRSGLPSNTVTAICESGNGDLWIGTTSGLARFNGSGWTSYTEMTAGLPSDEITALTCTDDGTLWVGASDDRLWPSHGGVAAFDGSAWTTFSTANSLLPDEQIECLAADPQGNVWIGTARAGIAVIRAPQPAAPELFADLAAALEHEPIQLRTPTFDHYLKYASREVAWEAGRRQGYLVGAVYSAAYADPVPVR